MTPDGYLEEKDWKRFRWFKPEEFACKCGCGFCRVKAGLVEALTELRLVLGQPVYINSGCRCKTHNAKVGGDPKSQHLIGAAADVRSPGHTPDMVRDAALKVKSFARGGIGHYPAREKAPGVKPREGWVHVDVRSGGPARWEG